MFEELELLVSPDLSLYCWNAVGFLPLVPAMPPIPVCAFCPCGVRRGKDFTSRARFCAGTVLPIPRLGRINCRSSSPRAPGAGRGVAVGPAVGLTLDAVRVGCGRDRGTSGCLPLSGLCLIWGWVIGKGTLELSARLTRWSVTSDASSTLGCSMRIRSW